MELMSNIHPPQEVLLKVMCSERLPDVKGYQLCDDDRVFQFYYFNDITKYWYTNPLQLSLVFPTTWYEPATRIVLTEEEYSGICMKQYDEGYSDATKEARDEIANNYRPNDN